MSSQVNQEALIANEFNKQYPYDDMNGWDRKLFKSGYQAATQSRDSEINSLKQRVEELEKDRNEWYKDSQDRRLRIIELTASNNQLREALGHMVEGNVPEYDINNYKKLLSTTNTQSLADHDNEVIAPYKKALEFAEYMAKSTEQFMIAINQLDEADQEEDEETVEIMQEKRGEHWRAVNSSIYEFRQRSDRALKATP